MASGVGGDRGLSPTRRYRADARDWFSPEEVDRGRAYQRPLTFMGGLQGAAGLAVALAFIGGETATDVVEWLGSRNWVVQLAAVVLALEGVSLVFRPWFSAWRVFVHDRAWGLSTQTPQGWIADQAKELALGLVLTLVLAVPLYALIRTTGLWWVYGWLLFSGFGVLLGFLFPVVLAPLFNRFEPLDDDVVAPRVRAVAERAGLELEGVYVVDASRRSRATNAYVAGLGRTRRVVLFDTLLEWPVELVEQVVAHELGHWRHGHLARQVPLLGVLQFFAFFTLQAVMGWEPVLDWVGVEHLGDPRTVPALFLAYPALLAAAGMAAAWLGRVFERQADLHALAVLEDPAAFEATFRRLAADNKADVDPPWWRRVQHSHPPVPERLAMAKAWARSGPG